MRYLGDSLDGTATGLACDGLGDVFVTGETDLARLPPYWATTTDASQASYGGSPSDGYLAELNESAPASSNDNFANRASLSGARATAVANSNGATAEAGEPAHAGFPAAKSLWWTWTAPANGQLEVATVGSGFDTVLGIYTGNSLTSLKNAASNDDETLGVTTSRARFPVTAGTAYQIAVDGKNGASGSVELSVTFSAPANDDFANRAVLSGFPASAGGSNVDATLETAELGAYFGYYDDRSVWWSWTAPLSGDVAISTTGSDFDTELLVFTGGALTNLALVAANDNETNGLLTSRVTIEAQQNTTYQLCVRGMDGASGAVRLNVGPTTPPANDDFTNSAALGGALSVTTNYSFDATSEPGEPPLGGSGQGGKTLWWTWTAPTNGWLRVSTEGSDFDTRLGVFTGARLTNLVLTAYNDDARPGLVTSLVDFPVAAGADYHIAVDGSERQPGGTLVLTVFFYEPPLVQAGSVALGPGGVVRFHVTGTAGKSYLIQTSTNLVTWADAPGPSQMDGGDGFDYIDAPPPATGARFYRVKEAP